MMMIIGGFDDFRR